MRKELTRMIEDFERGRLSRRDLISGLCGFVALAAGAERASGQPGAAVPSGAAPTFRAVELNHIALSVSDVQRSQRWYQQHLGLEPTGQEGFLTTGRGWLALFRGASPGLHHYCYGIRDFEPDECAERLRAAGLTPKRRGRRLYFDDPDGIECQLAQAVAME